MQTTLELRAGIEPALSPWHSDVIPLDQRSPEDFELRISNLESRISNLETRSRFAIRHSKFCGAGGRIRTFTKPGLSRSPLPIGSRQRTTQSSVLSPHHFLWYRRRDSNPHQLVSKTSASARLGYAGTFEDRRLKACSGSDCVILDRPSSIL